MDYSEIFNRYQTDDNVPYFNILKKVQLPEDKLSELYQKFIVPHNMPWVTLSYYVYNDLKKYWVFLLSNTDKKLNPLYAKAGETIYIIKPKYIELVENLIIDELK